MLMGVSSQKISVRLKRTVAHKATQTEALSWLGSEGPSSHFVLSSPRKTAQDTLYVMPSPMSPCPSPVLVRKRAFVKWENKESFIKSKEELRHLRLPTYQELEQVPSFFFFQTEKVGLTREEHVSWRFRPGLLLERQRGRKGKKVRKGFCFVAKKATRALVRITHLGQTGLPVAIRHSLKVLVPRSKALFTAGSLRKTSFYWSALLWWHHTLFLDLKASCLNLPSLEVFVTLFRVMFGEGNIMLSKEEKRLFSSLHRKPPP